jgi:hypothetical protein
MAAVVQQERPMDLLLSPTRMKTRYISGDTLRSSSVAITYMENMSERICSPSKMPFVFTSS